MILDKVGALEGKLISTTGEVLNKIYQTEASDLLI